MTEFEYLEQFVRSTQFLSVQDGDVFVVHLRQSVSEYDAERIRSNFHRIVSRSGKQVSVALAIDIAEIEHRREISHE